MRWAVSGRAGWSHPTGGSGEDDESDLIGTDVGIDGGAASAEEAAVHVIDE